MKIESLKMPIGMKNCYLGSSKKVQKKVEQNSYSTDNRFVGINPSYWASFRGGINFMADKDVSVMVNNPEILAEYAQVGAETVNDIRSRAGREGQFLNWAGVLPKTEIENLDKIYDMAQQAKADGATDLVVLGIGGSRHTTEAMLNMLDKNKKVHFYSAVDPISFDRFIKGLDLNKTKFLVVSKSGGTLETTTGYNNSKKAVQDYFGKEDVSDKFIAMTDASSEKSALRREVDKGEIKLSGLVHDDVGGRFSIFDDATIFAMAYSGVSKSDIKEMLEASLKAQEDFLNPDVNKNDALKQATFNVNAKRSGKHKHGVEYFGDAFYGATLWEKQMKNESLKSAITTDTNVGPAYLHYNAEADLDEENTNSFYTFINVKTDDKVTNAILRGVKAAYSSQHPISSIELKDLSPSSIARFIELKHFETLYTGNMLRRIKGNVTPGEKAVPEVLQPNVEKYKVKVKEELALAG